MKTQSEIPNVPFDEALKKVWSSPPVPQVTPKAKTKKENRLKGR